MEQKSGYPHVQQEHFHATAPPPSYAEALSSNTQYQPHPMNYPHYPMPQPQTQYVAAQSQIPYATLQPQMQISASQQPSTVVVHSNVIQSTPRCSVGPEAQYITCPNCGGRGKSKIDRESTSRTHLWALVLFLVGCWPCCFFPYCMDSCRNTNHYCSQCNTFLGTYQN